MTANDRQQPAVTDTDGTPLRAGPMPHSLPMPDGGRQRASQAGPVLASLASRGFLTLAIAAALSGCAALPQSAARPQIASAADYASSQSLTAPVGVWPSDAWWQSYGDPQLDSLIREALAGAPDIAVAEARLRRAQAGTQVAEAAGRPQASASASAIQQKHSYNYLTPRELTPQGWDDYGSASLSFSWQLDFWGRNRAALAAATSDANAAKAEAAQARLTIATAIASAYAELARQHAAHDTAVAALDVRARTADLFRERHANGLETLGSVRQVEARRESAAVDVLAIEEQMATQRNRIAALVGAGPDRGLAITRPTVDVTRSFALPEHLEAELLGRRPDVVAARMRAEAAARRIDQARAEFYPNVNLSSVIGLQSKGLDMLTHNGSSTGSSGPAISLPIFSGGALRGQLRGAEADYAAAVAEYNRAVLQALQELADAAVSQKALGPQIDRTAGAVAAAREAWRIQSNRYEGGLASYLDVLSAQDDLLANLRTQSDLQSRSFALDVALVRALGGGYSIKSMQESG
ncbi:MAG TPA: efflux transporter outer membrane subunit [Steroidobacteraceae bacterium]|nr:efflux transporter outer membrane subunit [Steroidobacteraceae bacterium]